MKLFAFLILFISFNLVAGGYWPASLYDGQLHRDKPVFTQASKCFEYYNETCIEMPNRYNPSFHVKADKMETTYSKTKSEIEACSGQEDCETKKLSKSCTDTEEEVVIKGDHSELFCTKTVSELVKVGEKIVVDQDKKDAWEAAEATKDAKKAALKQAKKLQECGRTVKALMLVRNASKGLTNAQKKQLVDQYASIIRLLDAGSLDVAREDIQVVTPDGVLVTAEDKTALTAELDACNN